MEKQPFEQKIDIDQLDFKASDLKKSIGLSYRQINTWDSKGALPSQRQSKAGWRRFTAKEVFVMAICKTLRDNFGVPIEKLGFVKLFMLQKNSNHLQYAMKMMHDGFCVCLLTNLKFAFIMDTDCDVDTLIRLGFLRNDSANHYILLKINPIVNKILAMKNIPPLKTDNVIYKQWMDEVLDGRPQDENESEVLQLIRNDKFKKVTVHTRNGRVVQADTEEDIAGDNWEQKLDEIIGVIKAKSYQTVTINVHDDKIVRLFRHNPIKFSKRQ